MTRNTYSISDLRMVYLWKNSEENLCRHSKFSALFDIGRAQTGSAFLVVSPRFIEYIYKNSDYLDSMVGTFELAHFATCAFLADQGRQAA